MNPGRDIASAVLAGGAARRMDGVKAGASLAGRPLISYPLDALRAAGLEPFVVTKRDRLPTGVPGLGEVEVVIEPDEPRHPLVGILAALRHAAGQPVVVVGCDLPLLTPQLLRELAGRPGGTVIPRAGGRLQPLAARYSPGAAAAVERGIGLNASIRDVIAALDPEVLEEAELSALGDPERMFENVNTPADLERVGGLLDC